MEKQDRLGPYRLLRELSCDAMGSVYEAFEPETDQRRVAVRVLASTAAPDDLRARILAAKGLRHPNMVEVLDGGRDGSMAYVVTPLLEVETLAQYLARAGRIPPLQGLALAAQLLSALAFAHERGLLHGAVSPQHLLVTRAGELKLAGLGWAASLTTVDAPDFRAPEHILGLPADHRADLYSAALVTYELLAGRWPFEGQEERSAPRSVGEARAELPQALDAVFQRALAASPQARYQTAADMWAALQAVLAPPLWVRPRVPVAAVRTQAPVAPLPRFTALPPKLMARRLGLTFGVACAVLVGWMTGLHGVDPELALPTNVVETREAGTPILPTPVLPEQAPPKPSPAPQPAAEPEPAPAATVRTPLPPKVKPTEEKRPAPVRHTIHRVASASSDRPGRAVRSTRGARPAKPTWPKLQCGQQLVIAREICTAMRCTEPAFSKHPVCVRMYADQRAREQYAKTFGGP